MKDWREDAEAAWRLLSCNNEAQWFATREEPKGKRVMGGRLRKLDGLIATIRNAEALGWNLYLNANITRWVPGKKKLSREDVCGWRYIVVDLDPTDDAVAPPQPTDPLLLVANRIYSGRGYQYWIRLEAQPEPHSNAEQIMRGFLLELADSADVWCPGWKVDPTVTDLARVVRCPGSVNQRTGMRAVVEVECASFKEIPLSMIEHYGATARAQPQPPAPAWREGMNLLGLLPHLNGAAKRFILEGVQSPGRNRACYAACMNLKELGVPAGGAEWFLRIGAEKCYELVEGPMEYTAPNGYFAWKVSKQRPLSDEKVYSIVRQVYGG